MATKTTGISRDLLIHPGETIADILTERDITQAELATRTGVSRAYINEVISGKKNISAKFAFALEYALDVPKSFWLNLQANYDAQLLEFNERTTITDEERIARSKLNEVVKYLRNHGKMPLGEQKDSSILSLRKALQISDISKLKDVIPSGAFRMSASASIDPYVLGAWIRLCQISDDNRSVATRFESQMMPQLVYDLKKIMVDSNTDIQQDLRKLLEQYGIDFSVVRNFRGAPVQGYLSLKKDGSYRMVLTIRGAYADIFWFSLFHELGHIINGDIDGNSKKFIDYGSSNEKEKKADIFARDSLLNLLDYNSFLRIGDFSLSAIKTFAEQQNVMPYIVIGRLQKEEKLSYKYYTNYKVKYKWKD